VFVFDARGGLLWLADPEDDPDLNSVQLGLTAYIRDPFPAFRRLAAESVALSDDPQMLPDVAVLLQDDVAEVRDAAAMAIEAVTHQKWPPATRVLEAKRWWDDHRSSPQLPDPHNGRE
jgi:hypothetical protein